MTLNLDAAVERAKKAQSLGRRSYSELALDVLALADEVRRLEVERDSARRAHAIVVSKLAKFAGVDGDSLGLLCECGHTHVAGEEGEDCGCRSCPCATFRRAILSPVPSEKEAQ